MSEIFSALVHFGSRMNASSFGVKRSKFKVTVESNVLETALFGVVKCDILKITGLNFTKLSALVHFGTRMNVSIFVSEGQSQRAKGSAGGGVQSLTLCVQF